MSIAHVYEQYFDQVYNYVYFRTRNVEDAEDIVSTVFFKVLQHIHSYKPQRGATLRSWIFAITRNTLTDYYRERERHAVAELVEDIPDHSIQLEMMMDYRTAIGHLEQLPPQQQEIMILRYRSGLRNKEIAELLQIDQRSVASAITRALQNLRLLITN